ncbi:DUF4878 domain-containing protein [Mycobacterium vicinigordonae]|uniref:DUF4878 domain-containing protein n=1 Tax=Mycobacterium vicinigordonae TaxID=1719132 RepID=A0A7D6E566_9MYCO|nr:DUF4878 domain-containing protein [Mycobacterium vicinigordonae]QLL07043.1 DUF4878 domain-containing protein [Mycobacterium vicinigordonae]
MNYGPGPHPWGQPPNPADGATQAAWLPPAATPPPQPGWPGQGNPPPHGYQGWPSGPSMAGGQFSPPPGVPGQPNRKPLIIGLSVAAAGILVVIVVVAVVSFTGAGKSGSAGDAVRGYLEALAKGDAAAALSYSSDQPGSKDFLTDEVLKKQIAQWPITEIKILSDSGAFSFGQVHVSAKFGDNVSDVTLSVQKSGKDWKLDHGAIKVETVSVTENKARDSLTFFGSSVGKSPLYVFPGYVEVGSTNANVAVKLKKPFLLDSLSGGSYFNDVEYTLSDSGQSAIMSAISASLADCTRSTQLAPPNCPQHAYDSEIVDGSVVWGQPDLSGLKVSFFDEYRLEARVMGDVVFPLTARTKSGGTKTGEVRAYVSAKADVSQSPPVVTMR